ncbi:MAG: thermonuclease family protein [Alphaproteobacteria bacterium]|nr:thermonuclease family protein [Alphaproteobacteria bacterium]
MSGLKTIFHITQTSMLFALLSMLSFAAKPQQMSLPATVGNIIDGDTFTAWVKLENEIEIFVRVRFLGIDAPELKGECESKTVAAIASKNRLAELIPPDTTVTLTHIKDDKYLGRIDANVLDARGRDVGAIMLKENHAVPYGGEKRRSWCE